ncbi:MAG: thioredoxin [Cyanobacteria bacterium SIG30]|nr:thioredoxin [Cyanobacteria bacterium SIG30]
MSNAKDVTDITFEQEVLNSDKLTLVDFWASWCGPCRKLGPVLDEIAQEYEGRVNVFKLNTDDNMKTTKEYQISGLPSIVLFKDGKPKEILVGLMPKSSIVNNIEKYL